MGGMAATGAAGTTTVQYGSMREKVLALTAVLANGEIIHTGRETRKLSAGYDSMSLTELPTLFFEFHGTPQ